MPGEYTVDLLDDDDLADDLEPVWTIELDEDDDVDVRLAVAVDRALRQTLEAGVGRGGRLRHAVIPHRFAALIPIVYAEGLCLDGLGDPITEIDEVCLLAVDHAGPCGWAR